MKNPQPEKGIIVVLFVLVLVIFSFAQRDSKKLDILYTRSASVNQAPSYTASSLDQSFSKTGPTGN